MISEFNHLGQSVGFAVPSWSDRSLPPQEPIAGRYCHIVPLDPDLHASDLYLTNSEDKDGRMWSYIPVGPFPDFANYLASMKSWLQEDWYLHAIIDRTTSTASGVALYMSVEPGAGSVEIGVMYSPRLQRTTAGTEAMYLLMRRAFDELGYRRYVWKCNVLNTASIYAAKRLGFQFEGTFRQAEVLKGRNRDTAWFSILDREWPPLRAAFERWLEPENFDPSGQQRRSLAELRDRET
jgi:RimJ/RimL family protein N-acetyltransferase